MHEMQKYSKCSRPHRWSPGTGPLNRSVLGSPSLRNRMRHHSKWHSRLRLSPRSGYLNKSVLASRRLCCTYLSLPPGVPFQQPNPGIYGAGPTRLRNTSLYLTCRRSSLGSPAQSEGRCCAAAAGAASSPLPGGAHGSMRLCLPSTAPAPPLFTLTPQNSSERSSFRVSTSCSVPGATPRWTASPGRAVWASTTSEQDPRTHFRVRAARTLIM